MYLLYTPGEVSWGKSGDRVKAKLVANNALCIGGGENTAIIGQFAASNFNFRSSQIRRIICLNNAVLLVLKLQMLRISLVPTLMQGS